MNLGRLARGRRLLTAFWGTTVVQVAAVAFDVKILKQASKVSLMPLLWSWSRTQDAPPLLQAALLASAAGDLLLETDLQLAGIAAFAAAHACYLAVFLANPAQRSWRVCAAYGALWAALIAVLSHRAWAVSGSPSPRTPCCSRQQRSPPAGTTRAAASAARSSSSPTP